jgi:hypothetical protein
MAIPPLTMRMPMKIFKETILPVLLAAIWISISEFVRNEYIMKSFWVNHFQILGMTFPSGPLNGAVWGIWSLMFAAAVFILSKKFSLWQTTFLSWLMGFVMMWVVIGNLGILPFGLLWFGVPLSILESFIASVIVKSFRNH